VSTATILPDGPFSSPKYHIKLTRPRSTRRTNRCGVRAREEVQKRKRSSTTGGGVTIILQCANVAVAAENACGENVDGAQWCAPLSREPPRAFACVVANWGPDVSSADGRRAAAADRTAGRAHDRCKGARRAALWARGGGTCRRSLCACAPRRSNTAIIPWKHPVPQFAQYYYIYISYTVTLSRGSSFSSPKTHISSVRKT